MKTKQSLSCSVGFLQLVPASPSVEGNSTQSIVGGKQPLPRPPSSPGPSSLFQISQEKTWPKRHGSNKLPPCSGQGREHEECVQRKPLKEVFI